MIKKKISIIGGGACALILGSELDSSRFDISIYEKNPAFGRKFLVAGEGGLNLTHSENENNFISRYTPNDFIKKAFVHFSNKNFIKWLNNSGIETFVGSSGRIFPLKGIKPITVLNTLTQKITSNNTKIFFKHEWKGFSDSGKLCFTANGENIEVASDFVIFCMGGASWPVTGSSGDWANHFSKKGITVSTFKASNCAFQILWPKELISGIEGGILKNSSITCDNQSQIGEVVLTRFGMEGSGIYPLSPHIRKSLELNAKAEIYLDLKPTLTKEKLIQKLVSKASHLNLSDWLKTELKLNDAARRLLKQSLTKDEFLNGQSLVSRIKQLPLSITGVGPIDDAISTVGGIDLKEINENFELTKMPGNFVLGEMLDFDAPTGGYLLQSCFSMGKYLADYLNKSK